MTEIVNKKEEISLLIENMLGRHYNISPKEADKGQIYRATAMAVQEILIGKRRDFNQEASKGDEKTIYYFCMEFLMGRSLKNNLYNLGLTGPFEEALRDYGVSLDELYELEPDAGLGNGGLGRLAACFMDALASQNYSAMGYSLRYEYGFFRQKIVEGSQIEMPDVWLPGGDVWLLRREDVSYPVYFGGEVEQRWNNGKMKVHYHNRQEVTAEAYDMMVSGADSEATAILRLWRARPAEAFDMQSFSRGDYQHAMAKDADAEVITKVLYPPDSTQSGRELRMKQQYLLVSASLQQIFEDHWEKYRNFDNLPDKAAIHINDTHPTFCIPEMMRLLIDNYNYNWERAFSIVERTVSYTNHTVLVEALEVWPEHLMANLFPRIYQIICEMNRRFCLDIEKAFPGEPHKVEQMSLIGGGNVRMAPLAVMGSHSVNGVSQLHSDILKYDLFNNFYQYQPEKFTNVTNGIAHRRWLCQGNPRLSSLLDDLIGPGYRKDAGELTKLLDFGKDKNVLSELGKIKRANKEEFSKLLVSKGGALLDPDSIFDVQVKRLHEYKRQLMNVLRLIAVYLDLLDNPDLDILPRTYLFGAKAAPSYTMAKETIRLICHLGAEIEKNPKVSKKLKVVFIENYCVSLAEKLMAASEISEQISLAGKEASGTGNMKMMINGALTIGTLDGANVEIAEAVGPDNIFIFGMDTLGVEKRWKEGYSASHYYQYNKDIKRVIDRLNHPINGENFSHIARYLLVGNYGIADPYMCLVDFEDYCKAHNQIETLYHKPDQWNAKSLVNIAQAGRFSADRSIRDYAEGIWKAYPIKSEK